MTKSPRLLPMLVVLLAGELLLLLVTVWLIYHQNSHSLITLGVILAFLLPIMGFVGLYLSYQRSRRTEQVQQDMQIEQLQLEIEQAEEVYQEYASLLSDAQQKLNPRQQQALQQRLQQTNHRLQRLKAERERLSHQPASQHSFVVYIRSSLKGVPSYLMGIFLLGLTGLLLSQVCLWSSSLNLLSSDSSSAPNSEPIPVAGNPTTVVLPSQIPENTFTPTTAPSDTPLPSATPTSTTTPTSTLTPEPTDTPLPTATDLPAIPSAAGAGCVPQDTLRESAQVVDIVDGDTITVRLDADGQAYSLRYIGIDAPEQGQAGESQATRRNRQLVAGEQVLLVMDVSQRDPYDRLLRYVFVGDQFVNYVLVREGFAWDTPYEPDTACAGVFAEAASQAQAQALGLWNVPPTEPPAAAPSRPGCDPAYPEVCIPPPPPDLDCGEISFRRFRVLAPDPHNFDGDHDGIGCER